MVCHWLGNSRSVAMRHYLQVTDEHYERAVMGTGKALQNAVQYPRASGYTGGNDSGAKPEKQAVFADMRDDAEPFKAEEVGELGVTGLEPVTSPV